MVRLGERHVVAVVGTWVRYVLYGILISNKASGVCLEHS